MGVQNSMVTQISNSIVRTTHLTGLFTDLGIELSQFFYKSQTNEKVECQYLFKVIDYYFLLLAVSLRFPLYLPGNKDAFAACFLLIALIYDYIRLQFLVKEEISLA
jgi:uncharacterized membrane protein YoaK (UPF0700 family)